MAGGHSFADYTILALESIAGWHTHRRAKGKMVLGKVNKIAAGLRNTRFANRLSDDGLHLLELFGHETNVVDRNGVVGLHPKITDFGI